MRREFEGTGEGCSNLAAHSSCDYNNCRGTLNFSSQSTHLITCIPHLSRYMSSASLHALDQGQRIPDHKSDARRHRSMEQYGHGRLIVAHSCARDGRPAKHTSMHPISTSTSVARKNCSTPTIKTKGCFKHKSDARSAKIIEKYDHGGLTVAFPRTPRTHDGRPAINLSRNLSSHQLLIHGQIAVHTHDQGQRFSQAQDGRRASQNR